MSCKADRQIYSKLAWYRVTNISKSEQVASVQPCRSLMLQPRPLSQAVLSNQQGTNITLELPLPNASRRDEGLYACQVENIKTGDRTCLLRRLSLKGKNAFQSFYINVTHFYTVKFNRRVIVSFTNSCFQCNCIINSHNLHVTTLKSDSINNNHEKYVIIYQINVISRLLCKYS